MTFWKDAHWLVKSLITANLITKDCESFEVPYV